jgi:glyoxylase-like metal-dependent hydrolase (beta-lactamase superfamily II)
VHSFVVETGDLTLLVDTGIGNDKPRDGGPPFHMLQTGFLEDLAAAGFKPEAVDLVLCTHLHVDHVGWNTRLLDGRWVPTFPRARYLVVREEWTHWAAQADEGARTIMADSVRPVLEAGLVDLVAPDHRISPELSLWPTPGHTPGHVSLHLSAGGREAVITGDLMHHPIQCAEPDWASRFCTDPEAARRTRRAFLARCAEQDLLVLGTHFHAETAGRVVRHGEAWRFTA